MSSYAQIKTQLKSLKLSGVINVLEHRVRQAEESQISYMELIAMLLDDELELRRNRKIQWLLTQARLKANQTIETFDFKANPTINAVQVRELATLHFIEKAENIFLLGATGVGKTHLANALAHIACRRNQTVIFRSFANLLSDFLQAEISGKASALIKTLTKCNLLVIDDFAFKKMSPQAAEYLYMIVDERYQQKSIIFTSNRVIEDWMEIFPDQVMGNAILDRIAHNAHHIIIKGESYRWLKSSKITSGKEPILP